MGGITFKALLKSPWVFHLSTGSCNNCDIEILDCLTPRFDIERFGMRLAGSIRHADVLLVTGSCNRKTMERVRRIWEEQVPKPCVVVAIGECALSRGMFIHSYNDNRCWIDQSIQMYTALKYLGVETKLILYMEGSHTFRNLARPAIRKRRIHDMVDWFNNHLK